MAEAQKTLTFADAGSDPVAAMNAQGPLEDIGFVPNEPAKAAEEATPTETAPATPTAPQAPPVQQGPSQFEQMLAYQNAERMRAEQFQAQQEWQKRMEQAYTPPPPPANREELLTDPDKLVAYQQNVANWAANLQRQTLGWTAEAFQHFQNQQPLIAANAMRDAVGALRADQAVSAKLQSEGYSNPSEILDEVDRALQSNPQTYNQYRRDPASVEAVARFVISQRGVQRGAAPQGVAQNPSMPYSPGTQTSASGTPAANNAARRRAEAMLGRKISDKTINERFGRSWEPRF